VRLTRAHLEEDAGKSLHEDYHGQTGIDLNRAGTPLLEIVTEPDMRSAAPRRWNTPRRCTRWWCGWASATATCRKAASAATPTCRCAARRALGTRREIKNLNSFRFLQQAIDFEVQWQIDQIEDGLAIQQATVLFNPDTGETRAMRSKEDAHDYRYFPDPDLPPLVIAPDWIERGARRDARAAGRDGGALPARRRPARLRRGDDDAEPGAGALLRGRARRPAASPSWSANWLMGECQQAPERRGRRHRRQPGARRPRWPALIGRIADGTMSNNGARQVFDALWPRRGTDVDASSRPKGLKQMSDSGALEAIVDEVLAANPKSVEEYRAGKDKAFNALVGQVMKASKGKANPARPALRPSRWAAAPAAPSRRC
jgi:aspartyl-tRNA(Asn)/glutamyl-tRNA(Gln) amidotransferase subunit B